MAHAAAKKENTIQARELYQQELLTWNRNVTFYQREITSPFYQLLHQKKLTTFSLEKEGKCILDLGAGIGYFSYTIQQMKKTVVALDFSPPMLRQAKQNYPSLPCIIASAACLPFRNNTFDAVITNGVLHHLKAEQLYPESIEEIDRVLKKEGCFCFYDRNPAFFPAAIHRTVMAIKSLIIRLRGMFSASSSLHEPPFTRENLAFIREKGFLLEKQLFLSSLPFFLLIVVTNSIQYLFHEQLASRLRQLLAPFARRLEQGLANRWCAMEQCVKLRKRSSIH